MREGLEGGLVAEGLEGNALWGWQLAAPCLHCMPQTTDPPPGNAAPGSKEVGTINFSKGVGVRCVQAGGDPAE